MAKFNSSTQTAGDVKTTIAPNAVEELNNDMVGIDPDLKDILDSQDVLESIEQQTESERQPTRRQQAKQDVKMDIENRQEQFNESPEYQQQVEREAIPSIKERYENPRQAYTPKDNGKFNAVMPEANGGIFARAKAMVDNVRSGGLDLGKTQPLAADKYREKGRALPTALMDVNAISRENPELSDDFLMVSSIVTENSFAQAFDMAVRQSDREADSFMPRTGREIMVEEQFSAGGQTKRAAQNIRLGKEINREMQRLKGVQETTDIADSEAAVLGDAAQDMYAATNPDIVNRIVGEDGQVAYELTPLGAEIMPATSAARKKLFPSNQVRPAKAPIPGGRQVAEGKKTTKNVTGSLKAPNGLDILNEARDNLGSIPNVVDKQREKILYSTIIPAFRGDDNPETKIYAEINNFGASKMRKFIAAEKAAEKAGEEYNAQENMAALEKGIAQELWGVASEREGVNYLTYTIQAYNGRLTPNQTHLNPTTSKLARFVTRNAVPVKITKGSRFERAARQMYAMMLVPKADMKLPEVRDQMVTEHTPRMVRWGNRLKELLNNAMTDAELEQVAEAIKQGIPVNNPKFPQVKGLGLEVGTPEAPGRDWALGQAIAKKGEDGPHFIDGLIDFAEYHEKVVVNNTSHNSFFNGYADGKTNGLAANGIQMGSQAVAEATGVMRQSTTDLLDDGDLRDRLKDNLEKAIKDPMNGLPSTIPDTVRPQMYDVAQAVYGWRDLNKYTTMTFGYGLDVSGFGFAIDAVAGELYEIAKSGDPALIKEHGLETYAASYEAVQEILSLMDENHDKISSYLLRPYVNGVVSVLDEDIIHSRAIMKGSAMIAALANVPLSIRGPHGMMLDFGGFMGQNKGQVEEELNWSMLVDGKQARRKTPIYAKDKPTAAAPKVTPSGNLEMGGKAMGGIVPGPVQATDAATVASVVSGRSWKKFVAASNGNPYIHTIYDAFKMDIAGYDVMMEEVNKNWYNINMNWSYLEETSRAVKDIQVNFLKELDSLPDDGEFDLYQLNPMVDFLLDAAVSTKGNTYPGNLAKKLKVSIDNTGNSIEHAGEKAFDMANDIMYVMHRVGFDYTAHNETITGKQYKTFVKEVMTRLELGKRFPTMINKVNAQKKDLDKKIKASKRPILQYYAH